MMSNIFLAIPAYDGKGLWRAANVVYGHAVGDRHGVMVVPQCGSLLTGNCNRLYTMCLNNRKEHNLEWFAMLHADIVPTGPFLDQLIEEADKHGADMMAAVVPLKNTDGITSTALSSGRDYGQFGRLTMQQLAHPSFPMTFDLSSCCDALEQLPPPLQVVNPPRYYLLANTGCFVLRLANSWSGKLVFRNLDVIIHDENGVYHHRDLSEDWYFSRLVARYGGKVMCTTRVKLEHVGPFGFQSWGGWGTVANDCYARPDVTRELQCAIR